MKKPVPASEIYRLLYAHFGPRHWWPAASPFEVMVGAILTQNTAWPNVEKAIANLKKKRALSPRKLKHIPLRTLKTLIKPSGFYNEKAKKLKNFINFLMKTPQKKINREALLKVKGIGQETADSILLYALGKNVFVVDAYTKRIFSRHRLIPNNATYGQIQEFFTRNLPKRRRLFNEYHALIVEAGKNYCKKKKPLCKICPLRVVK
ncbi:MAG: endonuclease III domain-containing protein [Candidatus Omnitrophota bacterium]